MAASSRTSASTSRCAPHSPTPLALYRTPLALYKMRSEPLARFTKKTLALYKMRSEPLSRFAKWLQGLCARLDHTPTLTPQTAISTPCTLNPKPSILHPKSYTLDPSPYTPHLKPITLNPPPQTPNPNRTSQPLSPTTESRCASRRPPSLTPRATPTFLWGTPLIQA